MKTQPQRVLEYMKSHPVCTTNELRQAFFSEHCPIIDIPKAVSLLVKSGVDITTKRNRDGSATYTYNKASQPIVTPKTYIFEGNTAVEVQDGKQLPIALA